MYKIEHILVDDSAAKGSSCKSFHRCVPGFGYCVICDAVPGFLDEPSGKAERKIQDSRERRALIDELCRLRERYPEAKILGVSEIDGRKIRPSEEMNQLRREMSEIL